jgi:ATP-dependent helicase/nuclease subunit A
MKSDPEGVQIEMLEPTFNVPKFASSDSLSPAEKGMAMHTLMEHIDIKVTVTQADIGALIDSLITRNLLSDKEARSINLSKVHKFVSSPLAERMRNATELHKEIPFVLEIDAKEAYLPYADDGTLLVHGIIDCYFIENGRIVLVDYKSDYVGEKGVEALKSQYKVQLDIYRKALEKSFGVEVSEAYLYLFDVDECVDMM